MDIDDSSSSYDHVRVPEMLPNNSATGKRSPRRMITWDEEVIAEHEKERGTR
jgi:hypothetical protein